MSSQRLFSKSSKELFSDKFYEAMNSDFSDLSKFDRHCNNIYVHDHKDQMIGICKKFLRYLENCKYWYDEKSRYDVSILLNYWLYEKITDIYGPDNTDKISAGFSALQFVWGYFDYYRKDEPYYLKCKPNLEIVNHNDWDRRKKLYDYYVDYDILFGLAKSIDDECEFYTKIEEKKSLYEYFEKECLPPKKNCPEFYEKCKEYKPEKILSKLRCYDEMVKKKPSAEALAMPQNAKQELEPEGPRYGSGLPGKEDGSHDAEITSGVSQIETTVSHSILGVTPILLTASALYRYTPVGSWIRNLSGNNANSINNVDGEMEGFLGNTQESGNMFFEGRENYISYQPM
ncbi:PIR Superfamily Protein [Plasmodium ovale curtisi]|uniref:PIR Superfamily Protein n=1 Tax=Plasmodium ovale curtisi TaxID=864141 RepID=A0A1A8XCV0_PLAOA|nr:PIR Superfamily Protein [Plasmodium ovale curtisi]